MDHCTCCLNLYDIISIYNTDDINEKWDINILSPHNSMDGPSNSIDFEVSSSLQPQQPYVLHSPTLSKEPFKSTNAQTPNMLNNNPINLILTTAKSPKRPNYHLKETQHPKCQTSIKKYHTLLTQTHMQHLSRLITPELPTIYQTHIFELLNAHYKVLER
ncbi:hypothetical protein BDF14DRAFT_1816873 [Spinellus fusiger]|nr:hypothetical protein BDF14DRAFT_1816873 [Spinellus fusiger]